MSKAYKDHLGRPIVAVTGMGVITSLGQGLDDNWAALTGGVSGIHRITRFPTDALSTRISGTVDFIEIPAENAVERSYAMARETTLEALAQAGLSGEFNGPLFLAARRSSLSGMPVSSLPTARRRRASRATLITAFSRQCGRRPIRPSTRPCFSARSRSALPIDSGRGAFR